jgi:hypothetical protein
MMLCDDDTEEGLAKHRERSRAVAKAARTRLMNAKIVGCEDIWGRRR